jgi:hypothetical protein
MKPFNFDGFCYNYVFQSKEMFLGRKLANETVCRNQIIPSNLLELWRLQTPANTHILVSKMTPAFAKFNLLSIHIIYFHFHFFI